MGDPAALDGAIAFLEADPVFFGSGYVKEELIRLINRLPATVARADRLRAIAVDAVDRRGGREFRRYCRLARHVDAPELRETLATRLSSDDADVRRRASWMIDALDRNA